MHWRAKGGLGSFNYRLIFKDIELPFDSDRAGDDLPRFTCKAWDQDVSTSTLCLCKFLLSSSFRHAFTNMRARVSV